LDKFPQAFSRFEEDVPVGRIKSFRQLMLAFGSWSGEKWIPTDRQLQALKNEARKIGIGEERSVIRFPSVWWRHETVMVKEKGQIRYRDLKSGRFIKKP
jgi:hypothetical protein